MNPSVEIAGRPVGPGHPVYLVAEMSANHGQRYDEAVRIVRAMKDAGADAVKIQTYTPDTLTLDCNRPEFRIGKGTLWEGKTLYQLYGEAYTPWDWQPKLKAVAEDLGLHFFSTPFDDTAVDVLEALDVPAYKIASFELVDAGLLRRVARTGKPVILSTGMATRDEIDEAVGVLRGAGCESLILLKCSSAYPARPEEMNLRTIPDLAARYGCPVGLSDHTLGIATAVAAVALGACVIEKHFTISRSVPGPDSAFSLEPGEFKTLAESVREVEKSLGRISYEIGEHEKASRVFRRSLFVVADMKAGDVFTDRNVRSIRPGHGLSPKHLDEILGKRAARDIPRGTPMSWDLVSGYCSGR
ncbi:MAG: pseudaminic acid synthase [Kiritimatiellae bacterium]|nr:pseudaminic acid synthase [Kiritimatiellia bacterium]